MITENIYYQIPRTRDENLVHTVADDMVTIVTHSMVKYVCYSGKAVN